MPQLPKRLLSIDVLRAITMLLMIFVNDSDGIKHIPTWIGHADGDVDALGFADTIFPAFLFIVGLSLPFAIKNRIKQGKSFWNIFLYILTRGGALLIMGFYHVNLEDYNSHAAIISKPLWAILITTAFFLIWLDYPETVSKVKKYVLMGTGMLLLIAMAIIYKGGDDPHHPTGMDPSWWGILGIIGWAYLVCALIYLVLKGKLQVLIPVLLAFIALNICLHTGILDLDIWVINDASSVALVMFGIVISEVYAGFAAKNKTGLIWPVFAITGVLSIAVGLIIRPHAGGISKIHSTPAWVLICSGITILVFELLIYIVDVKGKANWFKLIKPAGTSTLTCYLVPYYQFFILKLFHVEYPDILDMGITGLLRSVVTAVLIILLVGLMEKKHLRLKI